MSLLFPGTSDDQLQEIIKQEEKRAKRNQMISASISLLLLLAALVFGGLSLLDLYKKYRTYEWLATNGKKAKAEVEGIQMEPPDYVVSYKFRINGQDYQGSGKMKYEPPYNQEEIYYDEANPNRSRLASGEPPFDIWAKVIPPAILFILSLIWRFLLSPMFFKAKKRLQHR